MAAPQSKSAATILAIRSYLADATAIPDWDNHANTLTPLNDGTITYAGCVTPWRLRTVAEPMVLSSPVQLRFNVRLLVAQNNAPEIDLLALDWAQELDRLLLSLADYKALTTIGASLAGTFRGFTFSAQDTLKIAPIDSDWSLNREINPGDGTPGTAGAVAAVQRNWSVDIWREGC